MTTLSRSLWLCLLLAGCGGSKEPAAEPSPAPASEPAPEATPAEASAKPAEEPKAEAKGETPAEEKPAAAASEEAPREVKYVQSPEGLKVEVSGVRFSVTASTAKAGAGYAVKVSVKAEAMDKKAHSLLSTDNGPLAMAGSVTRKGQTTSFGDERKGESEKKLEAGGASEFSREWPGKGGSEKPLANGDSVELAVGLWGVGDDAQSRRPLKKFALVKAKVDGNKAHATVEPPPNVGK